jgi:hypothetical protein
MARLLNLGIMGGDEVSVLATPPRALTEVDVAAAVVVALSRAGLLSHTPAALARIEDVTGVPMSAMRVAFNRQESGLPWRPTRRPVSDGDGLVQVREKTTSNGQAHAPTVDTSTRPRPAPAPLRSGKPVLADDDPRHGTHMRRCCWSPQSGRRDG